MAEVASQGTAALPPHVGIAIAIALVAGVVLSLLAGKSKWLPSPVALGVGFLVPVAFALTILLGALLVTLAGKRWPAAVEDLGSTAATGVIAGEALMGVGIAALQVEGGSRRREGAGKVGRVRLLRLPWGP